MAGTSRSLVDMATIVELGFVGLQDPEIADCLGSSAQARRACGVALAISECNGVIPATEHLNQRSFGCSQVRRPEPCRITCLVPDERSPRETAPTTATRRVRSIARVLHGVP